LPLLFLQKKHKSDFRQSPSNNLEIRLLDRLLDNQSTHHASMWNKCLFQEIGDLLVGCAPLKSLALDIYNQEHLQKHCHWKAELLEGIGIELLDCIDMVDKKRKKEVDSEINQ